MNQGCLRLLHSNPRRQEFAEHQRQICHNQNAHAQRQLISIRHQVNILLHHGRQDHAGADTDQNAHKGNPQLNNSIGALRVLQKLQRLLCPASQFLVIIIQQPFQPALVALIQ